MPHVGGGVALGERRRQHKRVRVAAGGAAACDAESNRGVGGPAQSETRERECELRCWGADIMLRSLHVYGACGTNATLSKKNGQPDSFTIVLRRMTASPTLFIFVLMDSGLLTVKRRYLRRVTNLTTPARINSSCNPLTAYISSLLNPP